ncbi:hypothetical protein CFAM422_012502 [Trichoderma lentiforme]|uniref:Uncharacterized protein n=1 Tax=Trichoderma lentiforme TaxID=1567552 RepID=A0A9P4X3T6_9HYPO|nr:hypothetical protein CFAM422_012502 [Trichoderma lentiforme]
MSYPAAYLSRARPCSFPVLRIAQHLVDTVQKCWQSYEAMGAPSSASSLTPEGSRLIDDGALARFWVLCATDAGMRRIVMTNMH